MLRILSALSVVFILGLVAFVQWSEDVGQVSRHEIAPPSFGTEVVHTARTLPSLSALESQLRLQLGGPRPAIQHALHPAFHAGALLQALVPRSGAPARSRLRTPAPVYWDPTQDAMLRAMIAPMEPFTERLEKALAPPAPAGLPAGPEFQNATAMRELTQCLAGAFVLAVRDQRDGEAERILHLAARVFEGSAGASVIDRQVRLTNETTFLWSVAHSLGERGELPPALCAACRPLVDGHRLRERTAAGLVCRLQFLSKQLDELSDGPFDGPAPEAHQQMLLTVLDTLAVVTETRECLAVSEADLQAWWSSKRTGGDSLVRFADARTPSAAMLADALAVRRLSALALELESARWQARDLADWHTQRQEILRSPSAAALGPRLHVETRAGGQMSLYLSDAKGQQKPHPPRFGTFRLRAPRF